MKLGWFDIKTKFKKILRSTSYSKLGQEFFCILMVFYIKIVHLTSKKILVNEQVMMNRFKNNQPLIFATWHHRIMMCPFIANRIKLVNKTNKIAALASKHGDGRLVSRVMEKFGIINIAGSTRGGRKSNRGIDIFGLKEIFRVLKNHLGIAITPDGPRGPEHKINGEIIKISRKSGVPIVPIGIGYSKFFELKTWDKFKVPLPFGKICYYYGEEFIVGKDVKDEEIPQLNLLLEEKINLVSIKSDQF